MRRMHACHMPQHQHAKTCKKHHHLSVAALAASPGQRHGMRMREELNAAPLRTALRRFAHQCIVLLLATRTHTCMHPPHMTAPLCTALRPFAHHFQVKQTSEVGLFCLCSRSLLPRAGHIGYIFLPLPGKEDPSDDPSMPIWQHANMARTRYPYSVTNPCAGSCIQSFEQPGPFEASALPLRTLLLYDGSLLPSDHFLLLLSVLLFS